MPFDCIPTSNAAIPEQVERWRAPIRLWLTVIRVRHQRLLRGLDDTMLDIVGLRRADLAASPTACSAAG